MDTTDAIAVDRTGTGTVRLGSRAWRERRKMMLASAGKVEFWEGYDYKAMRESREERRNANEH